MSVIMRRGLGEKLLAEAPASSCFGGGRLYITNMALVYEVESRGIYLDFVPLEDITGFRVCPTGVFGARKIRISWREDKRSYHLDIRTTEYARLYDIVKNQTGIQH